MQSNSNIKYWAIGVGVIVAGFGALFLKKKFDEVNNIPLTQQQVVRILKLLRREKYIIYNEIATLVRHQSFHMRGNQIQQFINEAESPIKFKESMDDITEKVCKASNTTTKAFSIGLQTFKDNSEIKELTLQHINDYETSLTGKIPNYNCNIPASFTKQKFIDLQNKLAKKVYLNQVIRFKKFSHYSKEQIQQNPHLLSDIIGMNHLAHILEDVLIAEELGTEFQPPTAVYHAVGLHYSKDVQVQGQAYQVQKGYQRIFTRYWTKIINRSISEREFQQLQEEVTNFQLPAI